MQHITMLHCNHDLVIGTALDVASKHIIGRRGLDDSTPIRRRQIVRAPGNVRRIVLLWALLFAFAWQGFVAQTHRHLNPISSAAATTLAAGDEKSGGDQPADTPANCSICREIAGSGPALLPVAAAVAAPYQPAFHEAPSSFHRPALARRTHLWRSRAPPLLQA